MDPNVQRGITRILPALPDGDSDYSPVFYRPDSIQVISAHIRVIHSLAPAPRSELSRQINESNIALVQRRIEAMGDLDPKRILKCFGYRFRHKSFMIVDLDGKEPLSRLVKQSDLNMLEKLKLLYETGKATQYLHSLNPPAVHGALHPNNILIATPNSAVLSDFGLANVWRLLEPDRTEHGLGNELYDTWLLPRDKLGYTAPEYILSDTGEMLPPADIYAFATVILA
ncbi:hypothetical protein FS837_012989 [Tulasnella sp. UAMH 9824]|nr:hypothetical protein FS837_012989 [Tulasnella sp. UAMH 9824]